MIEKPLEQMGLRDLRAIARQQMPAEAWHHFNGGAETKATFHRNPRSFRKYLFRQRIFHDIVDPDITTELFGHKLPIPAITAPVGSFSLIGMDTVRPVKIGDEVPLSTKDGKPRRGQMASPKDIEWMKQQVSLPVVVKGIMGPEDARMAVNAGADGLVVSNHGGRILDFNRAALEALPEVVDAVGSKVPVLLDSGIRSGGDIVKAMALGAKAVLTGRPVAWGVAACGPRGVERVFAILSEEIKRVLCMTGVPRVRDVT